MRLLLLLMFIGVPLLELALLLWIADVTHPLVSIALVIVTGVAGVILLRVQGLVTAMRIRDSVRAGKMPTDPLIDAGFFLLAAGLLLTPGVLTDIFALTLLLPMTRAGYRAGLKGWFKSRFHLVRWPGPKGEGPQAGGEVVEGEVVEGEIVRGKVDNKALDEGDNRPAP